MVQKNTLINKIIEKLMHDDYGSFPKLNTETVIHISKKNGKSYYGNTDYEAILCKTIKGNHNHGGELPQSKFIFKKETKVEVRYATVSKCWWIKFPACNSCSLKTNTKEGIDFEFI